MQSAALPAIRASLFMSYAQVGLLLGLPKVINTVIEPVLMLLGDAGLRKRLVMGGGVVLALAILLIGSANSFAALLIAFIVMFPASGAFVSLSQATLIDLNRGRESHSMARWTVAGALGNVIGPLLMAGLFGLGFGWRPPYLGLAVLGLVLVGLLVLRRFPAGSGPATGVRDQSVLPCQPAVAHPATEGVLQQVIQNLREALRNRRLLRWIFLLEISDLLLDVFMGYAALYFADVVGFSGAQVSLVVGGLTASSLIANVVLIPLLERWPGRQVVRVSALLAILVYLAWLLVPWTAAKIGLTLLVPFATLGWYPVLKGEAYASAPGRSGTVEALTSAAGLLGGALVFLIGGTAQHFGLPVAMWLLLAAPVCLALFT